MLAKKWAIHPMRQMSGWQMRQMCNNSNNSNNNQFCWAQTTERQTTVNNHQQCQHWPSASLCASALMYYIMLLSIVYIYSFMDRGLSNVDQYVCHWFCWQCDPLCWCLPSLERGLSITCLVLCCRLLLSSASASAITFSIHILLVSVGSESTICASLLLFYSCLL